MRIKRTREVKGCTECPLSETTGELWTGRCEAFPEEPREIPEASLDGPPPRWCPLPMVLVRKRAPKEADHG